MELYVFIEKCTECGMGSFPVGVTDSLEWARQRVLEHSDLSYEKMDLNTLEAKYAMSAEMRERFERAR
jgi:hypothetical protein